MLGNPHRDPALPHFLFLAASCSPDSIVGFSLTLGVQPEAGDSGPTLDIPTPLYNVATLGLEPARLGTKAPLPTGPGPLPIVVTLRSADTVAGPAGLRHRLDDPRLPFKLGAFGAKAAQFDTYLCSRAPCSGT